MVVVGTSLIKFYFITKFIYQRWQILRENQYEIQLQTQTLSINTTKYNLQQAFNTF